MVHVLSQLVIPAKSGAPEDNYVNTFHWLNNVEVVSLETAESIVDQLHNFFDVPGADAPSLTSFMPSDVVEANGWRVKVYDASFSPLGPPAFDLTFNVTGLTVGAPYPSEVALCLSYQGANPAPGTPHPLQPGATSVNALARRRGRVYLGPFSMVEDTQVAGENRPPPSLLTSAVNAGSFLAKGPAAPIATDAQWTGWSGADGVAFPITKVWCDNAWDTQRSRGRKATNRVTRVAPF